MAEKKPKEEKQIEVYNYEEKIKQLSDYRGGTDMNVQDLFTKPLSQERQSAIRALYVPVTPKYLTRTHPGKGKEFTYIPHHEATRVLIAAMQWMYDYEVVSTTVYDDGSASALCKLTVHIPIGDGNFIVRKVQEVGAWETYPKKKDSKPTKIKADNPLLAAPTRPVEKTEEKDEQEDEEFVGRSWNMSKAHLAASAASRGLLRCMMRLFGFGIDLYSNDDVSTNESAWTTLKNLSKTRGIDEEQLKQIMKMYGFEYATLANHYEEAYTAVISASYMINDGNLIIDGEIITINPNQKKE